MLHAMDASAARSQPISLVQALGYRIENVDLVQAQFFLFQPNFIFGVSTAILFCPALLFLPVIIFRFFYVRTEVRQKLFPLLLLSLLALLFSSRWHVLLTLLPVMDKFRWPFKVFLFADFFLLASLVWCISSWAADRAASRGKSNLIATGCLIFVLLAEVAVSLSCHDGNTFSKTTLPTSANPLPPGMDPRLGRVIAIDNLLPEIASYRFFTHTHATFFAMPSLGGYDPLVGREQLRFALGLDFPNLFTGSITPAIRQQLDARAVRYWIVDPRSPQFQAVTTLDGLRQLESEPDRVVFEDTRAAPLVYSARDPAKPCALTYSGNSILIPLNQMISPMEISVGPTDGWWYRVDRGPWLRPIYQNDRLKVDFQSSAKLLEIAYFDPRFGNGFCVSGYLILLLLLMVAVDHYLSKRMADKRSR
jgi:hypothetical protein